MTDPRWPPRIPPADAPMTAVKTTRMDLLDKYRAVLSERLGMRVTRRQAMDVAIVVACEGEKHMKWYASAATVKAAHRKLGPPFTRNKEK